MSKIRRQKLLQKIKHLERKRKSVTDLVKEKYDPLLKNQKDYMTIENLEVEIIKYDKC